MAADALIRLIQSVYSAAGDPEKWQDFICRVSTSLNSPHAGVWHERAASAGQGSDFSPLGIVGFDPPCLDRYSQYYAARNVYMLHGRDQLRPGAVRFDEELCPRHVARHSEFFADWVQPHRIGESALFSVIVQERSSVALLLLARDGEDRYDERDRALVVQLMPHVQQAFQLHRKFVDLQAVKTAAEDGLDHWSVGVIVIGTNALVLVANRAARAILDRKDALLLKDTHLHAATARETSVLQGLIRNAIQTTACLSAYKKSHPHPERVTAGGAMLLERPTGDPPLRLQVFPVGDDTWFVEHGAGAIVFVTDPLAEPPELHEALSAAYGLTRRERRVARELLAGKKVPTIAKDLGVKDETVKSQAGRIYEKTGTRGQAAFIRAFAIVSSIQRPRT